MNNLISQLGRYLVRVLTLVFENKNFVGMHSGSCNTAMGLRARLFSNALHYKCFSRVFVYGWQMAFVLVLFPDWDCFSFSPLFRVLQLIIGIIGVFKLFKVLHKENLLERLRPAGKMYYLWFTGVSPPDLA